MGEPFGSNTAESTVNVTDGELQSFDNSNNSNFPLFRRLQTTETDGRQVGFSESLNGEITDQQTQDLFGDATDGGGSLRSWSLQGSEEEHLRDGLEPQMPFSAALKRASPSEAACGRVGIDDNLFFKMVKAPRLGPPKLPWQSDSMAPIFGKAQKRLPMPWLNLPSVGKHDSLAGSSGPVEPPEKVASRTPFHVKRLLAIRLAQTDDQLRAKALRKLRDLVLAKPTDSQLGRTLLDTAGQLTGEDVIARVFSDAFCSRATSTLVKRSTDYYKMATWMFDSFGLMPLQLSEELVYQYLSFLRSTEAAPTSADSAVKAIWFMHSTAVFSDFNPKALGSRVTGVCRDMYMRKRVLKQAPCFPASVVLLALEDYALYCKDLSDSMFTNFILFCIYASCRIGDATKITSVQFSRHHDVFLIETETSEAKNTNTMERRRMLLPFTAIGWGLHPNPWCIKWKQQLDQVCGKTIMPAYSEVSGKFLDRRLTTSEANLWLKEVLVRAGMSVEQASQYSTHSCKSTVPTWAGKFGGFSTDERRLLTHHMDKSAVMPLTYSRDNLTELHSRIFRMLTAIRNFEFNPDDSNAARIYWDTRDLRQLSGQEAREPPEWSEKWAESESDVSEDECFDEGCQFLSFQSRGADSVVGDKLVHRVSMVVHAKRDEDTLWCGRKLTANYRSLEQDDPDVSQLPLCQQCDKSQP